ncbi:MAG TPA: DedA family protein [Frankiaceae bacterium]|jgi:membrane-associated protein|nr:DedA family protein [Frankiaceae bacterium]
MPLAMPFTDLDSYTGVALYLIVWTIVFVESGLLVGFFLPGDTLLISAGIVASKGHVNVALLIAGVCVAAIVGDNVGYTIGKRAGRPLLERRDGRVLNQHNLRRASAFYERWGSATIVLARVVPMVRTFAPLIAGCTEMPYRTFFVWNVVGGVLWGVGVTGAGYLLGEVAKEFDKYALAAAGFMTVLSLAVAAVHYVRAGKALAREQGEVLEDADL